MERYGRLSIFAGDPEGRRRFSFIIAAGFPLRLDVCFCLVVPPRYGTGVGSRGSLLAKYALQHGADIGSAVGLWLCAEFCFRFVFGDASIPWCFFTSIVRFHTGFGVFSTCSDSGRIFIQLKAFVMVLFACCHDGP